MTRHAILLIVLATWSCVGALAGGTAGGQQDRRSQASRLYDEKCARCHSGSRATALPNVKAPDLFSKSWKAELESERAPIGADEVNLGWTQAIMDASFMNTLFSNATWHGRERCRDGSRPAYKRIGETLDGLQIYQPSCTDTVVVMPVIRLSSKDLNLIRNWITCTQYPGVRMAPTSDTWCDVWKKAEAQP